MPESEQRDEPWFSGRAAEVLLYRVNRRPALTLWSEQPDSVFDHIVEVLLFGEVVETGRRYRRRWLLGNRDIDEGSQMVTGQIGWEATGTEAKDKYDPERHEWVDAVGERGRSGRAPFAFDAVTRTLGVLKHPSFNEKTLPIVFGDLLRRGERDRGISASTDWDVEPIGDTATFREWLAVADFVEQVQFVGSSPDHVGNGECRDYAAAGLVTVGRGSLPAMR